MISPDQVLTHKNDPEGQERTANILNAFAQGDSMHKIAKDYLLAVPSVYYLIKKNASLIEADKHFEKIKRVNRLQAISNRISEDIAPKNVNEAVLILEQLRKEIDGEKGNVVDNRQVNIYVSNSKDSEQILSASSAEKNLHESKEI